MDIRAPLSPVVALDVTVAYLRGGEPQESVRHAYVSGEVDEKLIYSLSSKQEIRNILDFKGKQVGFGHKFSSGSFHLGAMGPHTNFSHWIYKLT